MNKYFTLSRNFFSGKIPGNFLGVLLIVFLVLFVGLFFYFWSFRSPVDFPSGTIVRVNKGDSLKKISESLEESKVIRSPVVFQFFVILKAGDKGVVAGDYIFNEKESVYHIASRLSQGFYEIDQFRITLPEGITIQEMGTVFNNKFPDFNKTEFLAAALKEEGYLFPDTYNFFPNEKEENLVVIMKDNFNKKIKDLNYDFTNGEKRLDDVIKMASIIEKESGGEKDKKIISSILWNRISIGMPLQVDASFTYINGKSSSELTLADLKTESLYNSYKHKGLPPTPICNPGFSAIEAALYPEDTPYLYYLHDKRGVIHYAKTFTEHVANKRKYIK